MPKILISGNILSEETQYYGDERNLPSLTLHPYVPPSPEEQEAERQKDQLQIAFIKASREWFDAIYKPNKPDSNE